MAVSCEIVLRWDATSEQRKALGAALWEWCNRVAEKDGIYQYLDNQGLADLVAGRSPAPGPEGTDRGKPQVRFLVRGNPARDGEAVLQSLRRALPKEGIANVRVEGQNGSQAPLQAVRSDPGGVPRARQLSQPGQRVDTGREEGQLASAGPDPSCPRPNL